MLKIIFILFILSFSCNSDESNITNELRNLNSNDQKDRSFMFIEGEKLNIEKLLFEDSLRLSRVLELDSLGLISSIADKYYANLIFWHNRDHLENEKLIYCDKVIQYCYEVLNEDFTSDENLIVLKKLIKNLKEDNKGKDVNFTNELVRNDFKEFKITAEIYKSNFFKPDSLKKDNLKIATDSLDNEGYLKRLKIKVYQDTRNTLKERYGNSLTEEMIEEAVKLNYENLINTGKALQNYYKEEKEKKNLENQNK